VLRHGARRAVLHVSDEGVRVLAPDIVRAEAVVRALVRRGLLDEEPVEEAIADGLVGRDLIATAVVGHGAHSEYLEICVSAAEDTVLDLMLWEGDYVFEPGPASEGHGGLLAPFGVDPAGLVARTTARTDERRAIAERLGLDAMLFLPGAGTLPATAEDDDRLQRVHALLDGRRTVVCVALRLGLSRFEVLGALRRLVECGGAQPADGEALAAAIEDRVAERHYAIARALCLQWAGLAPDDAVPLKKLAEVAEAGGNRRAEVDALLALARLHQQHGAAAEALEASKRAMASAPDDPAVVAALRAAAAAAGDRVAYAESALIGARAALEGEQPARARTILEALLAEDPDQLEAHRLRARALVVTGDRDGLVDAAMAVADAVSRSSRRQTARDLAGYFGQVIADVAPERGDLLERFRLLAAPRRLSRRTAIVAALLLLVGAGGFLLWPQSAASMLAQARAAVDAGDTTRARQLVVRIIDDFPESQEAAEASLLEARMRGLSTPKSRLSERARAIQTQVESMLPAFTAALGHLPDPEAQATVRAVLEPLEEPAAAPVRKHALRTASAQMRAAARALLEDMTERARLLGETAEVAERMRGEPGELELFLDHATAQRDAEGLARLDATADLLFRLARVHPDSAVERLAAEIVGAADALEKAAGYFDAHVGPCRVAVATTRVEQADAACREQAPKLMVAGDLEDADALYAELETLIGTYTGDPLYEELLETIERRQVPQFIQERRAQIDDIRRRIQKARSAEVAGDLDTAVRAYADLVRVYWLIRFETVFTLPLRVETIPPGAEVTIDGTVVGTGPTIVRYAWGSEARLGVRADGFAARDLALRTAESDPPSRIVIGLPPVTVWSADAGPRGKVTPIAVDGHVLAVDRTGHVALHDRDTGAPHWHADHSSLEGVRVAPVYADGTIHVARVDGVLLLLDPADGKERGRLEVGRPRGDLAALGARVALANDEDHIVCIEDGRRAWRAPLGTVASTGVVAAHDAFWVGTVTGRIVRVAGSPAAARRSVVVGSDSTAVLGLAGTDDGLLATTADGSLVSLDATGAVRWKRDGVGDPVGPPAAAGTVAAFIDRAGRVARFDARSGEPMDVLPLGAPAPTGLVRIGTLLVTMREDGRLWAYDSAADVVLLDVKMGDAPSCPPAPLPGDRIVLGTSDGKLHVVEAPHPVR
jgi:outer membrane protein assembly factor BamB